MGQRQEPRIETQLEIRLFGLDGQDKPFQSTAVTLEVSSRGASITGIRQYLKPGQMIGIALGPKKARFRIVWVGHHQSPRVGQIGVQQIGMDDSIWNVRFPEYFIDKHSNPKAHVVARGHGTLSYLEYKAERRGDSRRPVRVSARMRIPGNPKTAWAICSDLNPGGCFLEHPNQDIPSGTLLEVVISLPDGEMVVPGVVRAKKPMGIGIEFTHVSETVRLQINAATAPQSKFVQPKKENGEADADPEGIKNPH
jgi:PilZ domain-containing protein